MESFEEYRSTIETLTMNFSYLYDGDVKSSIDKSFTKVLTHDKTSPTFVIECINEIYNDSIVSMMDKSIQISLLMTDFENGKELYDNISMNIKNFKPGYIFLSGNGRRLTNNLICNLISNKPFPNHLYSIYKDTYICPLIEDCSDEIIIYVTDKAIQGLVYSIQNMDYSISKEGDSFTHTISYKLYDCDYNCYKLVIKDLAKWREEKINTILNIK